MGCKSQDPHAQYASCDLDPVLVLRNQVAPELTFDSQVSLGGLPA